MPRIDNVLLDSVFYLYETKEDAWNGVQAGGTGFWVGVQSDQFPERSDIYAITCKHIVKPSQKSNRVPAPIIRFNTSDGKFDVLDITNDVWYGFDDIYPHEQHDIAVYELKRIPLLSLPKIVFLLTPSLLTEAEYKENFIGLGDDVFMVGRYIDHDGVQKNLPSVRFGNIAMMPEEPLQHEEGYDEVSFIVEMRSLPGYSGSPVYVYVPVNSVSDSNMPQSNSHVRRLLGLQWSQPPYKEYQPDVGRYVMVYSGMSNVIPAWYISRLLNWEVFRAHRQQNDEKYGEEVKKRNAQHTSGDNHEL